MKLQESQTVEFKETWRDEYLKTICAFANTDGGALYIGVNDKSEVVGVENIEKLTHDLPNKVINAFGVTADVKIEEENGTQYIKICVAKSNSALSYHGKFYTRSGSTTQELKSGALQNLLLRTNNLFWDEVGFDRAGFDDIDEATVARFVSLAVQHNRLPPIADSKDIKLLFNNLDLITDSGELTRAAVLLFGKRPSRFFKCATFKIGRFRGISRTDLITQDVIEDNLFTMFEQAISLLRSKYLWSPISYKDMIRMEPLEIPEKAIREAILNAIIHKDYTSTSSITLSVFDPTVEIWNKGALIEMDVTDLSKPHGSHRRNPLIANIFYRAGHIEAWGRGTVMIIEETTKTGLAEPQFNIRQGGVEVIFKRNPLLFSENGADNVKEVTAKSSTFKPSARQQKAIDYVRENGSISNKIYQELVEIAKRTATNDLTELVNNNVFEKSGTSGESIKYFLVGH